MSDEPTRPLTARQEEIARLIAAGLSNGSIARHLGISKRTVEAHLSMIALRLGGRTPPRERILLYVIAQTREEQQHRGAA